MKENFDSPLIIFDGYCNFCSSVVQFIIKNDKKGIFRFVTMQSENFTFIKQKYFYDLKISDTVILIYKNKVFKRSETVLRIFSKLQFPLNSLWGFIIIPAFIRDLFYSWIAKTGISGSENEKVVFCRKENGRIVLYKTEKELQVLS